MPEKMVVLLSYICYFINIKYMGGGMSSTTCEIEEIGKHYAGIFASFCQSITNYGKQIDVLVEQERVVSKIKEDYGQSLREAKVDVAKQIEKIAGEMIERMIWLAQDLFAPEGAALKIDESSVKKACGYLKHDYDFSNKIDWSEFNPSKVWDHLVRTYGGEKGEEEGHRQTAAAIVKEFYIRPGKPIKTVGGRMVLDITVYIDSIHKKYSKTNQLDYGCIEHIAKALMALRGFAVWAGLDDLAASLSSVQYSIADHRNKDIVSRASYGGYGIRVITYLNKYEFQFDPQVAELLQVFLGSYAFNTMKEAA
jgi:hypothetical protein